MSKKQSDKRKGKLIIYQRPNWLIISWFVVSVVWFTGLAGKFSQLLFGIGVCLLAAWAVLELLRGINIFRRILGGAVLLALLLMSPFIWTVVSS